jgi:autotransporter translocation and assembly factor TamB
MDLSLDADYSPAGGSVSAKAMRKSQAVLALDSRWSGDLRRLATACAGKSPVLARLDLEVHEFPLGVVPLLQQHHVRGRVTGTARVKEYLSGDELDVRGRIEAKRGHLDISGKTFDIERGTVSFTGGAPDNPTISAVARYDAPAGYAVYAEHTGTVSQGKLTMRSEPPLNQDEIVTLLLFGSPDGSLGAGSGGSLGTALSVAGGTAARGLNRAISNVTDLDVSARVDTSTGAPRPELVLQLTPRVAAKVTEALGEPVPGQSPDRTFVTLDLRLGSSWSLSTTVGDRGATAFDMIWRHRY